MTIAALTFEESCRQHEAARRAYSNISRVVTPWERKNGRSVKALKWHVVDSLSSECSKQWKNALGELLSSRSVEARGYSLMIEDSELPRELWLMCGDACVMYAAM